eukprot:4425375-Amphidinium_carterae.1
MSRPSCSPVSLRTIRANLSQDMWKGIGTGKGACKSRTACLDFDSTSTRTSPNGMGTSRMFA